MPPKGNMLDCSLCVPWQAAEHSQPPYSDTAWHLAAYLLCDWLWDVHQRWHHFPCWLGTLISRDTDKESAECSLLPGRSHGCVCPEHLATEATKFGNVLIRGKLQTPRADAQAHAGGQQPPAALHCSVCVSLHSYRYALAQARRLEVRLRAPRAPGAPERKDFVHMLNCTLTATERTLCCVLENGQTPEGVRCVPGTPNCVTEKLGKKHSPAW